MTDDTSTHAPCPDVVTARVEMVSCMVQILEAGIIFDVKN